MANSRHQGDDKNQVDSSTTESSSENAVDAGIEILAEVEVKRRKRKHKKAQSKKQKYIGAPQENTTASIENQQLLAKNTLDSQLQIEKMQQQFHNLTPTQSFDPVLQLYTKVIFFITELDKATTSLANLQERTASIEALLKLILSSEVTIKKLSSLCETHDNLLEQINNPVIRETIKTHYNGIEVLQKKITSFADLDLISKQLKQGDSLIVKLENIKYFLQIQLILEDDELVQELQHIKNKPLIFTSLLLSNYVDSENYKEMHLKLFEKSAEIKNLGADLYQQKDEIKTTLTAEIHRLSEETHKISIQLDNYHAKARLYFSTSAALTPEQNDARNHLLEICAQEHAAQKKIITTDINFLQKELQQVASLSTKAEFLNYIENYTSLRTQFSQKPKSLQESLQEYNKLNIDLLHGFNDINLSKIELSSAVREQDAHPDIKTLKANISILEKDFQDANAEYAQKRDFFVEKFLKSLALPKNLNDSQKNEAPLIVTSLDDETTIFKLELEATTAHAENLEDCFDHAASLQATCLRLKKECENAYQALNRKAEELSAASHNRTSLPALNLSVKGNVISAEEESYDHNSYSPTEVNPAFILPPDDALHRVMAATGKSATRQLSVSSSVIPPERSLWQRIGGYILGSLTLVLGVGIGGLGGFLTAVGALPIGIPLVSAGGLLCISGALSIKNNYDCNASYEALAAVKQSAPVIGNKPKATQPMTDLGVPLNKPEHTQPSPIPHAVHKNKKDRVHSASDSSFSGTPPINYFGHRTPHSFSAPQLEGLEKTSAPIRQLS